MSVSTRKKAPVPIPEGECGFKGCEDERQNAGIPWEDGGSYMCPPHMTRLAPVRAAMAAPARPGEEDPFEYDEDV